MLFTLIIIYFSQGLLYPSGSLISQVSLALYVIICLFYLAKTILLKNKSKFVAILAVFIIMIALYYMFGNKVYIKDDFTRVNTFGYLKGVLFALGTFFPFYYLSCKGIISEKIIIRFFIIFGAITILRFFYFEVLLQTELSRDDIVNNAAYDVLSLFPFVLLIKSKRTLSNILMLLFFIIILMGFKRGAILIASIVLLIYFAYLGKTNKSTKYKLWKLLGLLFFAAVLIYISYNFYLKNEFLQYRILSTLEGGGSGRDSLFVEIYNYWKNSNSIINILFGYGLWHSIEIAGNAAHNDWFEILSNCGLLGFILYSCIFYYLYRFIRESNSVKTKYILIIITSIWFLKSLFSMGYMDMGTAPLLMILGYLLGENDRRKSLKKINYSSIK